MVLDVRLITFWTEIDQIGIELNNIGFAEFQLRLMHPIGPLEDYVAINPRNILCILGNGFNCDIEEPLFLPEHGTTGEPYQNIGIVVGKFKVAIKRQLHSNEWNPEIASKYFIVR